MDFTANYHGHAIKCWTVCSGANENSETIYIANKSGSKARKVYSCTCGLHSKVYHWEPEHERGPCPDLKDVIAKGNFAFACFQRSGKAYMVF